MKEVRAAIRTGSGIRLFALVAVMIGCNPPLPPSPPTMIALPRGVDEDPTRFRQQWANLARGPAKVRPRPARCLAGGCSVDIEIVVLGTAVPHPDRPPADGYPIAILRNLDPSDREARYDLDPSREAEYYLWIDKVPSAVKTRYVLLRVPMRGGKVEGKGSKQIAVCHYDPTPIPNKRPDVDFAEFKHPLGNPCRVADGAVKPAVTHAATLSFHSVAILAARMREWLDMRGPASLIWTDCDPGCCT